MSERSLFNVRYTFPGYTFLLFTILMSFEQLLLRYSESRFEFFTVFFGFLFLLSGAPMGYFVSQVWYLYFHHKKKGFFYRDRKKTQKKKYFEYLCDTIDDDLKLVSNNPDKAGVILDYLFNTSDDHDKLDDYITRRWDLYHIMGATEVSIILGCIVGICLKIYFIFNDFIKMYKILNFLEFCIDKIIMNVLGVFYFKDLLIIVFGILLIIGFQNGKKRVANEHEDMVDIMIRNVKKDKIRQLKNKLGNRSKEFFKNS